MSASERMTVAQALCRFLAVQEIERDGRLEWFFSGCLGIICICNVAWMGKSL